VSTSSGQTEHVSGIYITVLGVQSCVSERGIVIVDHCPLQMSGHNYRIRSPDEERLVDAPETF
jgi:hypothetical protein